MHQRANYSIISDLNVNDKRKNHGSIFELKKLSISSIIKIEEFSHANISVVAAQTSSPGFSYRMIQ